MPYSRPAFRRFALVLLVFAGAVIALFLGLNTWVNPLWVSPAPWTSESFADYRPIHRQLRTGKAGIARAHPWKAGFFGSSRIDIALDPALPQWRDTPAVNLAVSAGTLPETAPILRYTLARSPLELAIVGIDIGDLLTNESLWRNTGFLDSPFNPLSEPVEQTLRDYAGISTFQAAIKTILNKSRNRLPEYTPQGHRLRPKEGQRIAEVMRRDAIPHALRTIRERKAHPPGAANPWKAGLLQQILDDTKAAKCRLVLVIPPSHAVYLGTFYEQGDPDPTFHKDRQIMAEMVATSNAAHPDAPPAEIWDFNDFHPFNCEPVPQGTERMHWWLDGTHASKELGNIMLARIMGWPIDDPAGGDYGLRLDSTNLAGRDQDLRAGYERFRREQPRLWQWMRDSIRSYESTPQTSSATSLDSPE